MHSATPSFALASDAIRAMRDGAPPDEPIDDTFQIVDTATALAPGTR